MRCVPRILLSEGSSIAQHAIDWAGEMVGHSNNALPTGRRDLS